MGTIDVVDGSGRRLPARGPDNRPTKAPPGARYRARWRTPDGGSRTKTFARKIDAQQFLASVSHRKATGEYIDLNGGRILFGDYARQWMANQPHRASTTQSVESMMRVHILPTFERMPLGQVRPSHVQAWVTAIAQVLAPSTTSVVYGKVAAIFRSAVEDRLIAHSPCGRKIRLPRSSGGEVVPMTAAQVRAMVEYVPDRYAAFVVLLAGSGLRPSEALGLTVDRIDFLRRTIRVDRQLITLAGHVPELAPPKTPASVRTIPVPQPVLDVLAAHLDRYAPADPLRLIFTDSKRDPIRRNAMGHFWRRALAAANEAGAPVGEFTPHDLRHYAASVLIEQGASVKAVQRHLGHASATTTLDTYAHLWPDSEDTTRRALEVGLVGVVSSLCHEDAAAN